MMSSPEQTPKKTTVPIVESCRLPSNGCKQTLALLTVDPQRARHNMNYESPEDDPSVIETSSE
jgi:hypothetical protein